MVELAIGMIVAALVIAILALARIAFEVSRQSEDASRELVGGMERETSDTVEIV